MKLPDTTELWNKKWISIFKNYFYWFCRVSQKVGVQSVNQLPMELN